ncbi:hypothetical protein NESM_000444900 [Novymonas esmeraldas]|uniref:Uncharacterized protein n=1 Tax=Novymonas esmeraldas TaxID=1808958 RepID=A0AAW0EP91_9TRYP
MAHTLVDAVSQPPTAGGSPAGRLEDVAVCLFTLLYSPPLSLSALVRAGLLTEERGLRGLDWDAAPSPHSPVAAASAGAAPSSTTGREAPPPTRPHFTTSTTAFEPPTSSAAATAVHMSAESLARHVAGLYAAHPPYELRDALHRAASRLGCPTYQDPVSNDIVATADALRKREALVSLYTELAQSAQPRSSAGDAAAPDPELARWERGLHVLLGCHHQRERHCPHRTLDSRRRARQRRQHHRGHHHGSTNAHDDAAVDTFSRSYRALTRGEVSVALRFVQHLLRTQPQPRRAPVDGRPSGAPDRRTHRADAAVEHVTLREQQPQQQPQQQQQQQRRSTAMAATAVTSLDCMNGLQEVVGEVTAAQHERHAAAAAAARDHRSRSPQRPQRALGTDSSSSSGGDSSSSSSSSSDSSSSSSFSCVSLSDRDGEDDSLLLPRDGDDEDGDEDGDEGSEEGEGSSDHHHHHEDDTSAAAEQRVADPFTSLTVARLASAVLTSSPPSPPPPPSTSPHLLSVDNAQQRPFTIAELTTGAAADVLRLPRYAQTHEMNRLAGQRRRTCYRDPHTGCLVHTSYYHSELTRRHEEVRRPGNGAERQQQQLQRRHSRGAARGMADATPHDPTAQRWEVGSGGGGEGSDDDDDAGDDAADVVHFLMALDAEEAATMTAPVPASHGGDLYRSSGVAMLDEAPGSSASATSLSDADDGDAAQHQRLLLRSAAAVVGDDGAAGVARNTAGVVVRVNTVREILAWGSRGSSSSAAAPRRSGQAEADRDGGDEEAAEEELLLRQHEASLDLFSYLDYAGL